MSKTFSSTSSISSITGVFATAILLSLLPASAVPASADTLTATPNPCIVMPGKVNCTTSLSWSSASSQTDLYSVNLVNGNTNLVNGNPSGTLSINWINTGGFRFELRNGATVTKSLVVRGERATGSVSASPNPCLIPSGSIHCTSTVSWSSNVPDAMLHSVNLSSGVTKPVAGAPTGSRSISWIREHGFRFEVRTGTTVLGAASVYGEPSVTGSLTASPSTCVVPPLETSCSTSVSWSVSSGSGELWAGGTRLATGSGGTVSYSVTGSVALQVRAGGEILAQRQVSSRGALLGPYEVGVDYHSYGSDATGTIIVPNYSAVEETVDKQLAAMRGEGAEAITTRLWIGRHAGSPPENAWLLDFPPTGAQLQNLAQYAEAVAENNLVLNLAFGWLGAANYLDGSLDGNGELGSTNLTKAEFTSKVVATYTSILNELQTAGTPVRTFYFDSEAVYDPCQPGDPSSRCEGPSVHSPQRANENWFVKTHYQGFVDAALDASMEPSIYFIMAGIGPPEFENVVLHSDSWEDPLLNDLDGHRSMFWIYRSLLFLHENGLPIPSRLDLSLYPDTADSSKYLPLIDRVLDDAQAVLSEFGVQTFGAAETYNFGQSSKRRALCKAFALQASELRGFRLDRMFFWSTPYLNADRRSFGATATSPVIGFGADCVP